MLSASKALFAAKIIVGALIVTHSANVLHRDITPDNVILCKNGDIKLIDFGAARQVVAELSQTLTAILKPGFAPPEQYSKKGNQGPWTDVYAVGTTLYFMLTADIPDDPPARFDEDDTFKENTYDIDPALWEIIAKATKLKMNERYAGANDTQGFNLNFIDLNNNKEPDPDEYVSSILPIYTGIDRNEANYVIRDFLYEEQASGADNIQILYNFYDKLINETQEVPRNTDPTASTTHGAVIEHASDDLGFARAICDAAQRLGFESYVVDTEFPSSYQADARVKIDGEWYNIYTYLSGYMTQSMVFEVPLSSELVITHYWFLFCDEPFTQGAIGISGDFGEEFSAIMPPSDEETEYPTTNYYIEKYLAKKLYASWDDSVYNGLLADTKEWFDGGKETPFEFYLTYDYVDEMWKSVQESYISDLSEKYGITVSGFTGEYTGDAVRITFEA